MDWNENHPHPADSRFDGGDLDCGNGLLLLIRRHLDPLLSGQFLEILSTDASVEEDLPAWARLTGNTLVSRTRRDQQRSYLIQKGSPNPRPVRAAPSPSEATAASEKSPSLTAVAAVAAPWPATTIAPLSVMGIGSWPRPPWMLQAVHDYLEQRLDEEAFQKMADEAVRLAVAAQERAGVDVVTDGEQRRDNYASFVGTRLEQCRLVPITDLLPYVEDPDQFAAELRALDVPAETIRHPAVFAPLRRTRPLAVHELDFVQRLTPRPVKVALPGPYLLTRTMWLECVTDRVYREREELARDVVRLLREEVQALLAAGASLVQIDEPVLTEVVFGRPGGGRTFMCGALAERQDSEAELAFAGGLLSAVVEGLPRERLALHICRGNWSNDEEVALRGDYAPLLPLLQTVPIGTFFLEMCTPRAGELSVLRALPTSCRVGIGVVNQKTAVIESVDEIVKKAERAIDLFGPERVLLNPDCGFATFANCPITSAEVAEGKLAAIVEAARLLRREHLLG